MPANQLDVTLVAKDAPVEPPHQLPAHEPAGGEPAGASLHAVGFVVELGAQKPPVSSCVQTSAENSIQQQAAATETAVAVANQQPRRKLPSSFITTTNTPADVKQESKGSGSSSQQPTEASIKQPVDRPDLPETGTSLSKVAGQSCESRDCHQS